MDSSERVSRRIGERGIGGKKIAAQPGVGIVAFAGNAFAIRAHFVRNVFRVEQFRHAAPNQRVQIAAQQMAEALIASQNASLPSCTRIGSPMESNV